MEPRVESGHSGSKLFCFAATIGASEGKLEGQPGVPCSPVPSPILHPPKPLSQPVALRPCSRMHLGLFHIFCLTQGMTQVVFSTGPSLLAFLPAQPFHSQSPEPFVSPSPHTLQNFLPPPSTAGTGERCCSSKTWLCSSPLYGEV